MIRTERLILRQARGDDLEDLYRVMSNPEAMRYWSTPPHDSREKTRRFLEHMIQGDPAQSADFIVEFEDRAVGKMGFWQLPDIGYIFHPDCWGKGIASEAMQAVIAYVFATFPLDYLTADVDPRNAASARLLGRHGFRFTHHAKATYCINGDWVDSNYYRLDRPVSG